MKYECFESICLEKEFCEKEQHWFGFILKCKTEKVAHKAKELLKQDNNYLTNDGKKTLTVVDIKGFESWADGFMGKEKQQQFYEPLSLYGLTSILFRNKDFSENYKIEFLSGRCINYPHEILITNKKRIRELKKEEEEIDAFIDQLF